MTILDPRSSNSNRPLRHHRDPPALEKAEMESEHWEAVRQRAHELWLEEGCPEGKSDQHWQQAQQDVLASIHAAPVAANQPEAVTSSETPPCAPDETQVHPSTNIEVCAASGPADATPSVLRTQPKGTSLFKIRARQCRYIVSETCSPAIFCGVPTEGGSWCREHNARVFARSGARPLPKVERQLSAR